MSEDKPVTNCVCGHPEVKGIYHRTDGPCFVHVKESGEPKPVAAQEPVGEVVTFGTPDCKEVSWRKGKMPEVGTKLYDHAAPCARCEALEAKFRKLRPFNGRTRSAQEVEEWSATEAAAFIPAVLGYAEGKEREITKLQAKITEQAERIKALEAEHEQLNIDLGRFMAQYGKQSKKIARADAVIEECRIYLRKYFRSLGLSAELLASIDSIRKGNSVSYRIEERSGVKVMVFEQGCRPASMAEVQMWEELTDLRARCEKAEKDAERYRCLRDNAGASDWEFVGFQVADKRYSAINSLIPAIAKERT